MKIDVLKRAGWGGLAVLSIVLAGCASPDRRISREPELFASYPPETQELIKRGEVGIGFDENMVRLAVGEPDRKWLRTDAEGESVIWSFTHFESSGGMALYRGSYHLYDGAYPFYTQFPARKAVDYFRVTFVNGAVTTVESDLSH